MCGIAGLFDLRGEREINPTILKKMTDALAHRGPDGEGFFTEPGIGFGHRRLAIVDREGGQQPFHADNNIGVLSYNGEIYNHTALVNDLAARGCKLRTRSDTEVLAEGLASVGPSFVEQTRGMFAFSWWNRTSQTLLLARDRIGERPLYYAQSDDGFLVFASEVSAVLASGLIDDTLCPQAVCDYFHLGYTPDPKSIYKAIHKVPPGFMLSIERGVVPRLHRYWRVNFFETNDGQFQTARERLLEELDEAVRLQLMSDVPLGAFLSGGVDSSAIVASMAKSAPDIVTCSIGFDEASHDERAHARIVADQYNSDHREDLADGSAMLDLIDPVAKAFGEPFADASALPTYLVCKLARRHVTVALSGDGGDEVFGGYRRYPFFGREERIRRNAPLNFRRALFGSLGAVYPKLDWAPRFLRFKTTFQSLGETSAQSYLRAAGVNLPDRATTLLSSDIKTSLEGYCPSQMIDDAMQASDANDPLKAAQAADFATWLPARMLTKIDRTAMAHSLEVRPPLLDHKLVEWASRLPSSFLIGSHTTHGVIGKKILKAANETRLPQEILYRPKQGFGIPLREWLKIEGGPLDRLRDSSKWRLSGLIDDQQVKKMERAHKSGRADYSQELWSVVMFDAFLNNA